jgi:fructoselysine-6-P-deglycase FrlB-like protein
MSLRSEPALNGLQKIELEMQRMRGDAAQTFAANMAMAARVAGAVRETGRLQLLGMGGSHWANRTAHFAYRRLGVDVQTEVISETLLAPPPKLRRAVLLTSQSGDSIEIVKYLQASAPHEQRFGLTLNPDGALARSAPSLIAAGGMERAFAATRSIVLTHVMHLNVLGALGADAAASLAALGPEDSQITDAMIRALSQCETLIFTGRTELVGLAESAALAFTELSRRAALAFDGGQLRHGPLEMLSERTGVVALTAAGPASALDAALIETCRKAGAPVIVFDATGQSPAAADRVTQPAASGYSAVMALLPSLLRLIVSVAAKLVPDVGEPLRCSKVTLDQ